MRNNQWTAALGEDAALRTFQRYCAPTALAQLLDIPRLEAARMLLPCAGSRKGSVATLKWQALLRDLGGARMNTEKPQAEIDRKIAERQARFEEKVREYHEGKRLNYPRRPAYNKHQYRTVAEFLRRHPEGWIVFGIYGHTLVACNGRVVGDTMRSRSMKGRVRYAYHFTVEQVARLRKENV